MADRPGIDEGKFDEIMGFSKDVIDDALDGGGRVYFTGHLERPQEKLGHYEELAVESGMTYHEVFKTETPHVHSFNSDVNYVVSGALKVVLLDRGIEQEVEAGGIFFFPPGVPHVVKAKPGTRVLFVKSPGGDDKQVIDAAKLPEILETWASDYDVAWDGSRIENW